MDVDATGPQPTDHRPVADPMHLDTEEPRKGGKRASDEEGTTEGSFQSARENLTTRDVAMTDVQEREGMIGLGVPGSFPKDSSVPPMMESKVAPVSQSNEEAQPHVQEHKQDAMEEDESHYTASPDSTVEGSSPPKPLVRKSSLTFASLPAREPLATKKSIGSQARTSNADASKSAAFNRSSYLGGFTGGKSLGGSRNVDEDRMDVDQENKVPEHDDDAEEQARKLHNKSSTQRLHERINLLGKTQPARPTKSIPSVPAIPQPSYPELRDGSQSKDKGLKDGKAVAAGRAQSVQAEDEDDWIMPSAPKVETQNRPTLSKSRSVDVMEHIRGKENISGLDFGLEPGQSEQVRQQSPLRHQVNAQGPSPTKVLAKAASTTEFGFAGREAGYQKAISVSNPTFPTESTTPPGSPNSRFHLDSHLSASKSKLQSIMKSAKNLFSSSARVSNQARMETISPSPMRIRKLPVQELNEIAEISGPEHPVYPVLDQQHVVQPESPTQGRKTRSSTEKEQEKREKEAKERQRIEEEFKKARENERQRAAKFQEKVKAPTHEHPATKAPTLEQPSKPIRQSPRRLQKHDDKQTTAQDTRPTTAQSTRPQSQASQIAKPKEIRRPMKPTKDVAAKPKQPPVSIRVGTLSRPIPLSSTAAAPGQHKPAAPTQPRPTIPAKKPSTASQTSVSTSNFHSSMSSTTSKAKAPIVRKIERKPIAQQEAQKRMQQKESERVATIEDPKKNTQKQPIEQRRLDLSKKEQQHDAPRPANDSGRPGLNERPHPHVPQRPGLGASRPLPKPAEMQDFPRPPTASTAGAKRIIDFDQEDELARPSRPIAGQNYQPNESKRRRTEDEETLEQPQRPTMAPPIRMSNIKRVSSECDGVNVVSYVTQDGFKSSMFNGNYPMAPPPASMHAGPSRPPAVPQTLQQQPQMQSAYPPRPVGHPADMAKYTNGKIPFADVPNPPQPAYKTPISKHHGTAGPTPKTSSPMFQNGEHIVLDEIETSEDEDSEEEREKDKMPEWARTPNMNQILLQQETIDTDAIFGPIPPADLEEWFTKNKSHLRGLRMRTSSANWFGADRLTDEEVRNDVEARNKMTKDGGWSMGLAKLAE